jgi:hypothetical protein
MAGKKSGTERTRSGNGANLGFKEKLWAAADKMRGHTDAGECKHVALGLIFLKYTSGAFQERHDEIKKKTQPIRRTATGTWATTSSGPRRDITWTETPGLDENNCRFQWLLTVGVDAKHPRPEWCSDDSRFEDSEEGVEPQA